MAAELPYAAFDFFRLPRELRDEVYSYLSIDICEFEPRKGTLEVFGLPVAPVLAATQQLRREYGDHLSKTKPKMKVHGCFVWPKHKLPPQLCNMIRDINLDIRISCDRGPVESPKLRLCSFRLEIWNVMIRTMLDNLPSVTNLSIRMGTFCRFGHSPIWPYLSHGERFKGLRDRLLSLPHIKQIDILQCDNEEEWAGFSKNSGLSLPTLATWSVQTGWEIHPRLMVE